MRNHLNGNSYRILEDEKGITKKTACTLVNQMSKSLIHSNELTEILKPQNYCGILLIDGKYIPVKETGEEKIPGFVPYSAKRRGKTKKGLVVIACIDYLTHDIPMYDVCFSENNFDMRNIFLKLKEMKYPLKILLCDETMGQIAQVAKEIYPDVMIQICLTHYSKTIERCFLAGNAKRTYRALQKRLNFLDESFLIPTHHHDLKRAVQYINHMADLEFEYGYLWQVQELFHDLFWSVQNIRELDEWENDFNEIIGLMDLKRYPYAKKIKDRYLDYYEKREWITASIRCLELDIPRTTNLIEGWNSTTIELRIASIRGFKKERNARNYINAIVLKYRFHTFKDCKKKFKSLNGKSPLEIAKPLNALGFKFHTDDWILFCEKLKKQFKKQPPK